MIEGAVIGCSMAYLPEIKVRGIIFKNGVKITKGKGNWKSVFKAGLTKIKNGVAKRMSKKVIFKGIGSSIVDDLLPSSIQGFISME